MTCSATYGRFTTAGATFALRIKPISATVITSTATPRPMKNAAFGIGVPASRFNLAESRSIEMAWRCSRTRWPSPLNR